MKKTWLIYIIIITFVSIIIFSIKINSTKTINWNLSLDEQSKAPYGLRVFYKELPNIFKNKKIKTVYYSPHSYLKSNTNKKEKNSKIAGSFLIINKKNVLSNKSINALLKFVEQGNTLFISSYNFHKKLTDTLGVDTYAVSTKDSISRFYLKSDASKYFTFNKNASYTFFSKVNTHRNKILGYASTSDKDPNFIEGTFGLGKIYLHLEPKVFTNYHILKDDNYKYIEALISYLPDADIHFNSHHKIELQNTDKDSNLSWFLKQKSFKWAWYTTLFFAILFVIFHAKRKQRVIKIIAPIKNTTVAFVKTVSSLYFDTKNHKNLIDKKTVYFLEKIRLDFNLNTEKLDNVFIERLATKSGKDKTITKNLIDCINNLKTKNTALEQDLLDLNKHIESFYSN